MRTRIPKRTTLRPTAAQHTAALRVLEAATANVRYFGQTASGPRFLAEERAARAAFRAIDHAYVSASLGR